MPEARKNASVAYGDESLIESPIHSFPYIGAWDRADLSSSKPTHGPRYIRTAAVDQEGPGVSGWPRKRDPITSGDVVDNGEKEIHELIFRFKTLLSVPYREGLANRLITLFKDAQEGDLISPAISVGSVRSFYDFLQLHAHSNLKCPSISLTPEYNVYASWKAEQGRVLSMHFLPSGDVRFVIFKPNDKHGSRKIRIFGIATADVVMGEVEPHGVQGWISEC